MITLADPCRQALFLDRCIGTTIDSFIIVMKRAIALGFRLIIISIGILVRVALFNAGICGSRSSARGAIGY